RGIILGQRQSYRTGWLEPQPVELDEEGNPLPRPRTNPTAPREPGTRGESYPPVPDVDYGPNVLAVWAIGQLGTELVETREGAHPRPRRSRRLPRAAAGADAPVPAG